MTARPLEKRNESDCCRTTQGSANHDCWADRCESAERASICRSSVAPIWVELHWRFRLSLKGIPFLQQAMRRLAIIILPTALLTFAGCYQRTVAPAQAVNEADVQAFRSDMGIEPPATAISPESSGENELESQPEEDESGEG